MLQKNRALLWPLCLQRWPLPEELLPWLDEAGFSHLVYGRLDSLRPLPPSLAAPLLDAGISLWQAFPSREVPSLQEGIAGCVIPLDLQINRTQTTAEVYEEEIAQWREAVGGLPLLALLPSQPHRLHHLSRWFLEIVDRTPPGVTLLFSPYAGSPLVHGLPLSPFWHHLWSRKRGGGTALATLFDGGGVGLGWGLWSLFPRSGWQNMEGAMEGIPLRQLLLLTPGFLSLSSSMGQKLVGLRKSYEGEQPLRPPIGIEELQEEQLYEIVCEIRRVAQDKKRIDLAAARCLACAAEPLTPSHQMALRDLKRQLARSAAEADHPLPGFLTSEESGGGLFWKIEGAQKGGEGRFRLDEQLKGEERAYVEDLIAPLSSLLPPPRFFS